MTQLDSCHLIDHDAIDYLEHAIVDALHHSSSAVLPSRQYRAHRPWISQTTLQLIETRDVARANKEYDAERFATRQIRNQVKADRASWLDAKIANHDWMATRSLKSKA